jgi:excisionase family DNA binding protein
METIPSSRSNQLEHERLASERHRAQTAAHANARTARDEKIDGRRTQRRRSLRSGPPSSLRPTPSSRRALPSFLTVDELAKLLRVNRKTVYEALARGDIPGARRVRGTYRILRDAVLDWFGQSRVSRSGRLRP